MKVSPLLFVVLVATQLGQSTAADPLKCEAGPVTKAFGGTQWLVSGCEDRRSVAIVSAPGNPAMPFYFFFSPAAAGYQLVGEGTGSKQASAAALNELKNLSIADISSLGEETRRAAQAGSPRR